MEPKEKRAMQGFGLMCFSAVHHLVLQLQLQSTTSQLKHNLLSLCPDVQEPALACACVHWLSPLSQPSHPEKKSWLFTTLLLCCLTISPQKGSHHLKEPNLRHRGLTNQLSLPTACLCLQPFHTGVNSWNFRKIYPSLNTYREGWRFHEKQVHLLLQFQSSSEEAADTFQRSFYFHSCHLQRVSYFSTAH